MLPEHLTVSELNTLIKDVIDAGFPRTLWVCGEINGLDRYKSSAHLFFDIVEKDPAGKSVKAKIGVAIWAGVRPRIEAILKKAENAFELKDGIEVKLSGKIDFYPPYGTLRFIVDNIDPVFTLGKMAQDRQKLIAELEKNGILAKNKAVPLSDVPLNIGLVTSFDSAAYNDFLHELKKSGYSFRVHLFRALMQGKSCESSVSAGIKALNAVGGLDAIVITRGGGSLSDLAAFDAKEMALAIASSRYPVLTGIGHEINMTVADLAAHTFAKTPTAIAAFLCERIKVFEEALEMRRVTLLDLAETMIDEARGRLRNDALRLQASTGMMFNASREATGIIAERLKRSALERASEGRAVLGRSTDKLKQTIHLRFEKTRSKIAAYEKMVEFASPVKILKRGFSITRSLDGKVVRSKAGVRKGDALITDVIDGKIHSVAE
jgi:exodeoxyribonuclease VII large subunit